MTLVAKPKNPKKNPSLQRIRGEHHRKGQNYHKIYWPFLPMILVIGTFLGYYILNSNSSSIISTEGMLTSINQLRLQHDLPKLSLSNSLSNLANLQANQIYLNGINSAFTSKSLLPLSHSNLAINSVSASYSLNNRRAVLNSWISNSITYSELLSKKSTQVGIATLNNNPRVTVAILGSQSSPTVINNLTPPKLLVHNVSTLNLINPSPSKSPQIAILLGIVFLVLILLYRSSQRINLIVRRTESYLLKHLYLDLAILVIIVLAILLLRNVGQSI